MEQQLARTSGPQSLMSLLDVSTRQLARRFDSEINLANQRADVLEVSVFEGEQPASADDISKQILLLQSVWRDLPEMFWGTLRLAVRESGMSAERLRFAVSQFLQTHTYNRSFTPAELISIDKKITVARSMQSLRSKVKFQLEYEDIVMVEMFNERRFVLADDARVYGLNILARYHSPYGTIEWVGTYDSQAFKIRREAFHKAVNKYEQYYPKEMCEAFFEYWSRPMYCGDVMLKELRWSNNRIEADGTHNDLIEEYIDEWAVKHGYESRYKPLNYEKSKS